MTEVKKKRGFAAMDPERAREIQRMGSKASGGNFARNPELARRAGRLSAEARKNARTIKEPL